MAEPRPITTRRKAPAAVDVDHAPILWDLDCERSMLACVWLSGDSFMVSRLEAEDFVDPFHQWLLRHLQAIVEAGEPLDMVALLRRVKAPGGLAALDAGVRATIRAHLADLLSGFAPRSNAAFYFRCLRLERMRRAVWRLGGAMQDRVRARQDPEAAMAWAADQISRLIPKGPSYIRRRIEAARKQKESIDGEGSCGGSTEVRGAGDHHAAERLPHSGEVPADDGREGRSGNPADAGRAGGAQAPAAG